MEAVAPEIYDTLILSDLHLGADMSRAREALCVLKENRYRRLILLGDIFADLNFGRRYFRRPQFRTPEKRALEISRLHSQALQSQT